MSKKFIVGISRSKFLAIAILAKILASHAVLADTSSADYIFLLNNEQPNCQQIGKNYLEVRAFETENFYINICRKDDQYYYLGESKIGKRNTIFLPANFLSLGEIYRAHNGNVAYIVSILPHQAILTIERNGEQISLESTEINQCTLHHGQDKNSLQLLFQYSEKYLNSYATTLPNQKLSLLDKVKIEDLQRVLDFESLQVFNSSQSLHLDSCK